MGLTLLIIAACLAGGVFAAAAGKRPGRLKRWARLLIDAVASALSAARPKRFSPKNTLFLVGPSANHPACRLQRRLLKPAIAAFIREEVTVIEVYGHDRPRKNGEEIGWLDPALLRHALNAEDGFFLIYVDAEGRTTLRSEAPMVTSDILYSAGLNVEAPASPGRRKKSPVLKRLRAA